MTLATGIAKKLAYKKEVTFGTAPGVGSAQLLRRVSSSLELTKASYQSKEIRTDYQISDMRHGVRSVKGDIKGELSPKTFQAFFEAALRAAAATGATTGAIATVTAAAGPPGTFTRSGGSFFTDGFKVGDVVRWTGWTTTGVANNSFNYRITVLTATVMTVANVNGALASSTVAAKASGDSVTCTAVGKKITVPTTGHTNDSFTIEHQHSDISVYDYFTGCRVSSIDLNLPSTGMAEITVSFMGQDSTSAGTVYYTSPTAATTTGILAAVNGKLSYGGTDSGIVTALQIKIDSGMSSGSVVGSNTTPDIFAGRVTVTGTLTAYFQDANLKNDFLAENTAALSVVLSTDSTATSDFVTVNLPKIKLSAATISDGEQGLTITGGFQALLNSAGGTGTSTDATTISIQDSQFA